MLVAIAFYPGDRDQAIRLANWMNELGPYPNHELFILRDVRCQPIPELGKSFSKTHEAIAEAVFDGWPEGGNYFFRLSATKIQNSPFKYFLWMEPDAIPLTEGWLDAIDNEFKTVAIPKGKRFMGDRVEVEKIPLHMSGVGIYSNPIHAYAGEAYRAHDEAFDMAARHQIVPAAHFTKLIEHAWRHETFTNLHELQTQIRPEAVLFHSSKDGSLIDLLKSRRAGKQFHTSQAIKEREEPRSPCPTNLSGGLSEPEVQSKGDLHINKSADTRNDSDDLPLKSGALCGKAGKLSSLDSTKDGSDKFHALPAQDFSCDIFIRTYPGDYPWLKYCLRSIHKFCTGFRKIRIVSTGDIPTVIAPEYEWKVINDETADGYLAQQITKLYADVITDYQADYILHVDSDVIFTRPTTPDDFFKDGKPIWYHTPYANVETPWKPITEKFMGRSVEHEFMRRFPIIVPRWIYPQLREFCSKTHGITITDYIKNQSQGAFSEFNALGAYAWVFHRGKFSWWNTVEQPDLPAPHARQFRSWDGITPEVEKEIQAIFNRGIESEENSGSREPSAEGGRGSLNTPSEKRGDGASAFYPSAPPHSGNGFDVAQRVRELREYADASRGNSVRVGQQLHRFGFK